MKNEKGEYICDDCGENLGKGDAYDLMKGHLWSCNGEKAQKVKSAMAEEGIGVRYL